MASTELILEDAIPFVQFVVALAPIGGASIAPMVPLIVHLIEQGLADEPFQTTAAGIATGIAHDHPDWAAEQKRRYAVDAIVQLAKDRGIAVDTAVVQEALKA